MSGKKTQQEATRLYKVPKGDENAVKLRLKTPWLAKNTGFDAIPVKCEKKAAARRHNSTKCGGNDAHKSKLTITPLDSPKGNKNAAVSRQKPTA